MSKLVGWYAVNPSNRKAAVLVLESLGDGFFVVEDIYSACDRGTYKPVVGKWERDSLRRVMHFSDIKGVFRYFDAPRMEYVVPRPWSD